MSHFACIGLPFTSEDELNEFTERALSSAEAEPRGPARRVLWRDPSGALVAFHLEDDSLACTTPGFDGGARLRIAFELVAETPGCRYCAAAVASVLDEDDEVATRLAFQLVDPERLRVEAEPGAVFTVRVAAFADEVRTWPDDDVFERESADEPGVASESFLPTGLFFEFEQPSRLRRVLGRKATADPPGDEMAHGLITGHLLSTEHRTNEAAGASFHLLRVRSYGGDFDILAAEDDLPSPLSPGAVVQAHCWLVGELAEGA